MAIFINDLLSSNMTIVIVDIFLKESLTIYLMLLVLLSYNLSILHLSRTRIAVNLYVRSSTASSTVASTGM